MEPGFFKQELDRTSAVTVEGIVEKATVISYRIPFMGCGN